MWLNIKCKNKEYFFNPNAVGEVECSRSDLLIRVRMFDGVNTFKETMSFESKAEYDEAMQSIQKALNQSRNLLEKVN